jgi:hypothetical protein
MSWDAGSFCWGLLLSKQECANYLATDRRKWPRRAFRQCSASPTWDSDGAHIPSKIDVEWDTQPTNVRPRITGAI